ILFALKARQWPAQSFSSQNIKQEQSGMKQPAQRLGLTLAIIASLVAADARTLATTPETALVLLNHDVTFDSFLAATLLKRLLGRWEIPLNLDLSLPAISTDSRTVEALKGHNRERNHCRLLGLKDVGGSGGLLAGGRTSFGTYAGYFSLISLFDSKPSPS
ncbi:hypothetical protein FRB90_008466, partial [Tulasnella sp. 427]